MHLRKLFDEAGVGPDQKGMKGQDQDNVEAHCLAVANPIVAAILPAEIERVTEMVLERIDGLQELPRSRLADRMSQSQTPNPK